METKNLVPYTVYIPRKYADKMKVMAEKRNASKLIRQAVIEVLEGKELTLHKGYQLAIETITTMAKKEMDRVLTNRKCVIK